MGFDSIVYLTDPYGEILNKISLNYFLIALLVVVVIFLGICMYFYDKEHQKITTLKIQEALDKDRESHAKIRDDWIDEKMKYENNLNVLKRQFNHLEIKLVNVSTERDDAVFASKRRSKKIKQMEMVLHLKTEGNEAYLNKQLENPNRSMSSIINSYDWSKVDL